MLLDFLKNCTNVLNEEQNAYEQVLRQELMINGSIGFMPAITNDLYPVYALSCTSVKRLVSPDIFIVPIGTHDYWAMPYFEERVNEFYRDDEFREQFDIKLEEMILLNNSDMDKHFTLYNGIKYNVIYCRLALSNHKQVHLVAVPLTPRECWLQIIEKNGIRCDIIIDSHKGMGNWYEDTPLYRVMCETRRVDLLPKFYFKGRYISKEPPAGFRLKYVIPETIVAEGREIEDWQKELYEIDWQGICDD